MTVPIGAVFHIAHTCADVATADTWYREVLGAREFLPLHTLEPEKRDASLLVVADAVLEPVSPSFELDGWAERSFGRYHQRFGTHWHSIAWYCSDPAELWRRCRAAGFRVNGMTGPVTEAPAPDATLFTHPKDTLVQLQLTPGTGTRYESLDPRLRPGWDGGWWEREHPLGVRRLDHVAVVCPDLDAGLRVFVEVLGGKRLGDAAGPLTGSTHTDVAVGDTVVRLAVPSGPGPAAEDLAAHGPCVHAVAFEVADLDRAATYLESAGVRVLDRDPTTLITDPATTLGVPFHWVVRVS